MSKKKKTYTIEKPANPVEYNEVDDTITIFLRGQKLPGATAIVYAKDYFDLELWKWAWCAENDSKKDRPTKHWRVRAVEFGGYTVLHHFVYYRDPNKRPPKGLTVDHRDRNEFNNRHSNLREATVTLQNWNRRTSKPETLARAEAY